MSHDRTIRQLDELTSGNLADADSFPLHDESAATGNPKRGLLSSLATYVRGLATALNASALAIDGANRITGDENNTYLRDGGAVSCGYVNWSGVNDETAFIMFGQIGGVVVQKRVLIGAADSGGTGYRLLRILN
jgi:hypothetical protein